MYMYAAMADLAGELGDQSLLAACERLWHTVVDQRMYLTGGIGPSASNEGFTIPYDLPNETAYAETCAAVGMVFWNHRMLQFGGDSRYADIMERALYNGCVSGVSLDGKRFFYDNPLASHGQKDRADWFDCACCPPNIARLIASIGGYFYSSSADALWVHLYAESSATTPQATIRQTTNYPWDGTIQLTLEPSTSQPFTLNLRIPGWCANHQISVNGTPTQATVTNGYASIERQWQPSDNITLELAMPVQVRHANAAVRSTLGRVALQRGPLVYCLEGIDNPTSPLDRVQFPPNIQFEITRRSELLGGVTILQAIASRIAAHNSALYSNTSSPTEAVPIIAIPYCTWANRGKAEMLVWLRAR
jgi:uncharacterized protein